MKRFPTSALAVMLSLVCGCHGTSKVENRERTVPLTRDAATADDYVTAVQTATTPAAEADAIRALRQWEVKNNFTYTIHAVRVADNAAVNEPSASGQPVSVTVTIFRGRDVVRTFSFVPKDNRNLTLLGE
jgi:hypothetical protein